MLNSTKVKRTGKQRRQRPSEDWTKANVITMKGTGGSRNSRRNKYTKFKV